MVEHLPASVSMGEVSRARSQHEMDLLGPEAQLVQQYGGGEDPFNNRLDTSSQGDVRTVTGAVLYLNLCGLEGPQPT